MTANSTMPEAGAAATLLTQARVLIVDDSRMMRMGLIRALRDIGITQTLEAANGLEALQSLRERPCDLMLLDMEMPEMGGLEVLRELRRNPSLPRVPVIVISSADQLETTVECIEAGAEDYLPKSFNPTLLRARVTSSLEKKRLRDLEALRAAQLQAERDLLQRTQQRLEQELAQADRYVRSILPAPQSTPFPIDWIYQPSTELGGDAFGYHWIDDDHLAVYLLDVCGHGVGACLLSVTAINVIRSGALPGTDFRVPAAVLTALSNAFQIERQNDMYFTLWYGVYHRPSGILRHASGGHPPALLIKVDHHGQALIERLRCPGVIIGALPDMTYDEQFCQIPPGSILVVLCDGCFEISTTDGREGTLDQFEAQLASAARLPDGLQRLLAWAHAQHGAGPLDDDFSIVRVQL
jgi:sigma-B regulation protein RsbU (phosphoserine phosphatase)